MRYFLFIKPFFAVAMCVFLSGCHDHCNDCNNIRQDIPVPTINIQVKVVDEKGIALDGYRINVATVDNGPILDWTCIPITGLSFNIGKYPKPGLIWLNGVAGIVPPNASLCNNISPKVGVMANFPVANYMQNINWTFKIDGSAPAKCTVIHNP